jgi:nicotinate phosphoribosyltransferase
MTTISITGTYTDLYQLTMAEVYFLSGRHNQEAVFDYFFRKPPFNGGYAVFAGLENILEMLEDLVFTDDDITHLQAIGLQPRFLEFLKTFRFRGTIYSAKEGEVVFPGEPLLSVHGTILEAQLIETVLLNLLNFQSLVATKAARMRFAAGERTLCDFGLRRAQGLGGYHAARAAVVGGFNATSNVKASQDFQVPAVGTMAHAYIQSYDSELEAFREFAANRPENCVLLADTYDTLGSGVPNAITIAREMEQRGQRLQAIRLDSGDLAYLSKKARRMLDDAGLSYVKIAASNQLDEYVIKSLLDQKAEIDIFGVGTSLVTAPPDAALDGVYKLAFSGDKPRIKLSENLKKITLPGKKQVFRLHNGNGNFYGADVIALSEEKSPDMMHHPVDADKSLQLKGLEYEPLLSKVMENGKRTYPKHSLQKISEFCRGRLALLPDEHKRFEYPHVYKIGISGPLRDLRNELKLQFKK